MIFCGGGCADVGVAAFTFAWERPERVGKVVSWIGSFTNIRGGYVYPAEIRKTKDKPKPLRVLLQDGANDLDNLHGNWPLANPRHGGGAEVRGLRLQIRVWRWRAFTETWRVDFPRDVALALA